jgi:hypothetical protein
MSTPASAHSPMPWPKNGPFAAALDPVRSELEILNGHLVEMIDLLQQFLVLEQLRGQINEWEWQERLGLPHGDNRRKGKL